MKVLTVKKILVIMCYSGGGVMAKKKVYAVKKGKIVGIFRNWDECRDSVNGYPGAEYKSFFTEEEAKFN